MRKPPPPKYATAQTAMEMQILTQKQTAIIFRYCVRENLMDFKNRMTKVSLQCLDVWTQKL